MGDGTERDWSSVRIDLMNIASKAITPGTQTIPIYARDALESGDALQEHYNTLIAHARGMARLLSVADLPNDYEDQDARSDWYTETHCELTAFRQFDKDQENG